MSIFLLCAALSAACASPASTLNDEDIQKSITKISTELISRHDPTHCWENRGNSKSSGWLTKYKGGTTSLTTLSLLSAGVSVHAPEIKSAVSYLEKIKHPSTYVLATRTSIWSMLPRRYKKNLARDTRQLVSNMGISSGSWGNYDVPPKTISSASPLNREFGMIALREAARSGHRVPKKCWLAIAESTLTTQQNNGGWSYEQSVNSGTPSSNMTVAALNCLLGVDEIIGNNLTKQQSDWLHSSIKRALSWLNKHATTDENVGGTTLMSYLYGLERVAMSCGLAEIHNKDWFQDGARAIIKTHCAGRKAKGSTTNLSFALLFLSRGRIPIALCELTKEDGIIDPNRTADIISRRLSNQTEQSLTWQLVTNKERVESWLAAPVLFIQNYHSIPSDLSKLKTYLDRGGLIVMLTPNRNEKDFSSIAKALCKSITPIEVDDSHWSKSLISVIKKVKITTWHDGVRDRILLINGTSESLIRSKKNMLSKTLVNICCGAAELNLWKPRVSKPIDTKSNKTVWVAEHDGSWSAELEGLKKWKVKSKPINDIKKGKLVLVGGLHEREATDELAKQILRLAKNGSTVLVESIGGRNQFAATMQTQIEQLTKNNFTPNVQLKGVSGQRGWSIYNHKKLEPPMCASFDTGKVIIVNSDLRNGLLDHTAWGVHGYDATAAIHVIDTLLNG
jgi:hypothetical protein